jgi:hypothetical protein
LLVHTIRLVGHEIILAINNAMLVYVTLCGGIVVGGGEL